MNVLRKLVLIFFICFLVKAVFSQQHYIYIQSEEQQEFYVRTGSQIFNSSGNGYLVIPALEKNTHEIIIGFPGKKEPEWRFNCTINETDLGFVLKAKGREGVQLLNLKQKDGVKGTVVERHPQIKKSSDIELTGAISNDPFSSMLADVVNDPTIRQQLVIVEKETLPAAVTVNDSAKELNAGVPAAQTPPGKNDENVALAPPPVTAPLPQASADTATIVHEKLTPFVVKEIEKTNDLQSEKSSRAGAAEKAGNTLEVNTAKKYEPFVVREIHEPVDTKSVNSSATGTEGKEDSTVTPPIKESEPFVVKEIEKNDIPKTTSSEKARIEKSTDNNKETKYLPFVIKPVDNKSNNEDKTAKSETGKKAAGAGTVSEKENDAPIVVKKEDKAVAVEKDASHKSGSGRKNKDSAGFSLKEKQSPVEKKAILSSVRKTLERKSREGTDLIYVDENAGGAKDTIRIFIPVVQ